MAVDQISETDMALLDTVRTLYGLIIDAGITTHAHADRLLAVHQERWTQMGAPEAADMIVLLRKLATDPDVQARRAALAELRVAEPQGLARTTPS